MLLRSDKLWDWILGVDGEFFPPVDGYKPKPWPKLLPLDSYVAPARPVVPVVPGPRKSFGPHDNPLGQDHTKACQGEFEQMDPRTWQCLVCHLLHFTEVPPGPMEASSEGADKS